MGLSGLFRIHILSLGSNFSLNNMSEYLGICLLLHDMICFGYMKKPSNCNTKDHQMHTSHLNTLRNNIKHGRALISFTLLIFMQFHTQLNGDKGFQSLSQNQFQGKRIAVLSGHSKWVFSVCVTPDGQKIVSGSADGTVRVWDINTGKQLMQCASSDWAVRSVCVTPDGKKIVSAGGKLVRIWDINTGNKLLECIGHTDSINSVCVTPDGKKIISGSDDTTVCIWNIDTGEQIKECQGHTGWVSSVCVTPDGRKIISGSHDNTIRVWNANSGKLLGVCRGHNDWVSSVCVTSDGSSIISASYDCTIRIWPIDSYTTVNSCRYPASRIFQVCVTQNGEAIVSGWNASVRIWDIKTGKQLIGNSHIDSVVAVCITPDNKKIVSGSCDNTIGIWE